MTNRCCMTNETAWTKCGEAYHAAKGNLYYLKALGNVLKGLGIKGADMPLSNIGHSIIDLIDDTLKHLETIYEYHGWDSYVGRRGHSKFGIPENIRVYTGKLSAIMDNQMELQFIPSGQLKYKLKPELQNEV